MMKPYRYPTAEEIHAYEQAARRLRAETIARAMGTAARRLVALAARVFSALVSGARRKALPAHAAPR